MIERVHRCVRKDFQTKQELQSSQNEHGAPGETGCSYPTAVQPLQWHLGHGDGEKDGWLHSTNFKISSKADALLFHQ